MNLDGDFEQLGRGPKTADSNPAKASPEDLLFEADAPMPGGGVSNPYGDEDEFAEDGFGGADPLAAPPAFQEHAAPPMGGGGDPEGDLADLLGEAPAESGVGLELGPPSPGMATDWEPPGKKAQPEQRIPAPHEMAGSAGAPVAPSGGAPAYSGEFPNMGAARSAGPAPAAPSARESARGGMEPQNIPGRNRPSYSQGSSEIRVSGVVDSGIRVVGPPPRGGLFSWIMAFFVMAAGGCAAAYFALEVKSTPFACVAGGIGLIGGLFTKVLLRR